LWYQLGLSLLVVVPLYMAILVTVFLQRADQRKLAGPSLMVHLLVVILLHLPVVQFQVWAADKLEADRIIKKEKHASSFHCLGLKKPQASLIIYFNKFLEI